MSAFTFSKRERLCSRKLTEQLFSSPDRCSLVAYPLRMVWTTVDLPVGTAQKRWADSAQVQVLVSVSKRHFKRAVKRNRVKRQIREAYRLQKQALLDVLAAAPQCRLAVSFIWLSDDLMPTETVHQRMGSLLKRLAEKYDAARKS